MGTRHFSSMAGYKRWLAFGHIHGKFKVPGNQTIFVRGKRLKVRHKKR